MPMCDPRAGVSGNGSRAKLSSTWFHAEREDDINIERLKFQNPATPVDSD